MLDTNAVQQLIEQQINKTVNEQVKEVLSAKNWMESLEDKIINYTKDRIVGKFANSSALPEIVEAVKSSVSELFASGQIPGIEQYVNDSQIQHSIDQAVEQLIQGAVEQLGRDQIWLARIEHLINQAVVQRTVAGLGAIDIASVIHQRVDENIKNARHNLLTNFSSLGINDQATSCQFTVMDDTTVVENKLTTRDLDVVVSARIKDLAVTGSINTDNRAWDDLAEVISVKTLDKINTEWQNSLVAQVVAQIESNGVSFDHVRVGDTLLVEGNKLSSKITESAIQALGTLRTLSVKGETHLNETVSVLRGRLGINTQEPESALSIWDEEVSLVLGKHKLKQAYIGTNRDQGLVLGVNRLAQLEIGTNGLTTIKKLQVGLHKISHDTQVPGYVGTRGDIVFNSNPGPDRVFAWVCLGSYNWQVLKSAE